ncbi:alpha/beta hydrolase family protein [Actinocorallia lasiicapitis]
MRQRISAVAAGAAILACGFTGFAGPALAAGYEKGPDPTEASVTAAKGGYEVVKTDVPKNSGAGFNNGTIYAPKASGETFGAVAVVPGFLESKSAIDWYGPMLASNGFVVFTLNPVSIFDSPEARGAQLLASLDYLTGASAVKGQVDAGRLAVIGHSMGGGGTLRAVADRPELKAAVALAPWHVNAPLNDVKSPVLIFGSDNDWIAPDGQHARPFYDGINNAPEKAYAKLNNAGHMTYISPDKRVTKLTLSWLKRYVDEDTRYNQFLCPGPAAPNSAFDTYLATCPM